MSGIRPLREFVGALQSLLQPAATESVVLPQVESLMRALIADDRWLPETFARASSDGYRQYLLYADPLERFSVVSFVWGPGQSTPIHDHRVWGAIGVLRGAERAIRYSASAKGGPLRVVGDARLDAGSVDLVSPRLGDIHRVSNALSDRPSISIHAYGANIGRIERRRYDEHTGVASPFVSGYSSDICPSLWAD